MRQHATGGSNRGKHPLWPVWIICGLVVLSIVVAMTRMVLDQRPKISDIAVLEVPENSDIRFQAADFPSGELRLFRVSGTGIILAMKRLSDRRVHAALSSCNVCSRKGRNSYASKNEMVCGICKQPMRFATDSTATGKLKDRCPLPEISVTEEKETIVIATKDVLRVADQSWMK